MSLGLSNAIWRKSRRSHQQGECVEVAVVSRVIAVRDSKDPDGLKVMIPRAAFRRLFDEIRSGRHDV